MKALLIGAFLVLATVSWAQDQSTAIPEVVDLNLGDGQKQPVSVQEYLDRPDMRPRVDKLKETLNLGSDADVIAMVKKVNPEIIRKVMSLNIELTPEQEEKLEKLAMDNKGTLMISLMTGKIPNRLMKDAEQIVPELSKLDQETKQEVFKAAGKTANKMLFEKMVKAEPRLGFLLGDVSDGIVAQINARLLNIRKITLGGIEIENFHMKVETGYPKNGLLLISGEIKPKDSSYGFQGELLGFSHDIRKHVLDIKIAEGRVVYGILPWLEAQGGLNLGVRSYSDGTVMALDGKLGLRAKKDMGKIKLESFAETALRTSESNLLITCGGSAGLEILNKDFLQMQTGILSQLSVETNPREHGNRVEWFNGAGLSGHF